MKSSLGTIFESKKATIKRTMTTGRIQDKDSYVGRVRDLLRVQSSKSMHSVQSGEEIEMDSIPVIAHGLSNLTMITDVTVVDDSSESSFSGGSSNEVDEEIESGDLVRVVNQTSTYFGQGGEAKRYYEHTLEWGVKLENGKKKKFKEEDLERVAPGTGASRQKSQRLMVERVETFQTSRTQRVPVDAIRVASLTEANLQSRGSQNRQKSRGYE